jgi:uncharacterized protein YidB (DUF937 family)
MRFIHEVIEDLRGVHDEELTPLGAALEELLGGERGSLADLGERFTQARLGHIMDSWTGRGPHLPISTADLRRVLGEERVQDLATLAGLPAGEFLVRFARILPHAVHAMMTEGQEEPEQ